MDVSIQKFWTTADMVSGKAPVFPGENYLSILSDCAPAGFVLSCLY